MSNLKKDLYKTSGGQEGTWSAITFLSDEESASRLMRNPAKSFFKEINGRVVKINAGPTAAEFLGDEADAHILRKLKVAAFKASFTNQLAHQNSQSKSQDSADNQVVRTVKQAW